MRTYLHTKRPTYYSQTKWGVNVISGKESATNYKDNLGSSLSRLKAERHARLNKELLQREAVDAQIRKVEFFYFVTRFPTI